MSKKIVVIGSYIEALVMDTERIPSIGETLKGSNFRQTWGGKGSNQAVQAARLGAATAFVTKVGKDSFAENCKKLMRDEKVNDSFIFETEQLPTACGFIVCSNDGHNIITIDISALNAIRKADIDLAMQLIDNNTIVILQLEIPVDISVYAGQKAKEKGATVILNPAPATNLLGYDLSCVDYLTPNETEARICVGLAPNDPKSEVEVAKQILATGCKNALITLGEAGSLLVNNQLQLKVNAFNIGKAVDSTGAGDAFNAGLAVGLAENMPIEKAMSFANAVGGLSCTKPDTIPSYHSRAEVENFIAQQ